ncbi:MAG: hypothetical protein IJ681_09065 [Bacteroidales bacterium]|nr:hypothetical protein [Bacteroidales bacterium]
MKKIFIILIFIATSFCFIGCNKGKVYQQRHEFNNYTWERLTEDKTVTFNNITIEDTTSVYDVFVTIRHTPYMNEDKVKFLMKITTPEGITRESTHTVKLKDRYGEKWVGDAAGDLIDIEERCRSFVEFSSKGSYTISLTNLGTYAKTVGIMDIGIKVVKSDTDAYKNAE